MMKNKKEDLKMVASMKNSCIDLSSIAGVNDRLLTKNILIEEIREEQKFRRANSDNFDEDIEFLKETRKIEKHNKLYGRKPKGYRCPLNKDESEYQPPNCFC